MNVYSDKEKMDFYACSVIVNLPVNHAKENISISCRSDCLIYSADKFKLNTNSFNLLAV